MVNKFRSLWWAWCLVPLTVALGGDSTAPDKGTVRMDVHGDPLPPGAQARIGTTRLRHADSVLALAYSNDGKVLASASGDQTVCLWDTATGKLLRCLSGHENTVFAVALSKDGKRVISAGADNTVRLWDAVAGKQLWQGDAHKQWVFSVALSPDGTTVASHGEDATVRLWDADTGKQLRQFADIPGKMLNREIDGGNPILAKMLTMSQNQEISGLVVAFSPDGQTLAASGTQKIVRLWDVKSGQKVREWRSEPTAPVYGLSFSPDGKRLASAHGRKAPVHVWDVGTGQLAVRLGNGNNGRDVTFSNDGKRLAVGPLPHEPDICLLDVATWKVAKELTSGHNITEAIALAPDGQTMALAGDGWERHAISLKTIATGKDALPLLGNSAKAHRIALTPDGKQVAVFFQDYTIRLLDAATGKVVHNYGRAKAEVLALHFSPDGKQLVAVQGDEMSPVVDVATGKALLPFGAELGFIGGAAFSQDGRLAVFKRESSHRLEIWRFPQGKKLREINPVATTGRHLEGGYAPSPDGRLVAVATYDTMSHHYLEVWDTTTGNKLQEWRTERHRPLYGLAFSADGRSLAGGHGDGEVRVWETATGGLRCRIPNKERYVLELAFSPDGRTLVIGGEGMPIQGGRVGILHLWDLGTNKELGQLSGHRERVYRLNFSRDGKVLASLSWDSTALIWPVPARPKLAVVPLTPAQWEEAWNTLATTDAAKTYALLWQLAAAPKHAVPYLAKQVSPTEPAKAEVVALFRKALESDKFPVRQKAVDDLRKLELAAEPILRQLLAAKPSLEMQRRIAPLLARLERSELSPERLRLLRVLELLEQCDYPTARQLVRALASGAPGTWLTTQAQRVLERLGIH